MQREGGAQDDSEGESGERDILQHIDGTEINAGSGQTLDTSFSNPVESY